MDSETISSKSRLAAALLCFFLGVFGAHRFYLKKYGTAVLMLLTLGLGVIFYPILFLLGIWTLIDFIFIAVGSFRDKERKRVFRWLEPGPN
jgi:TM2 domain-containing membrane protein YozV